MSVNRQCGSCTRALAIPINRQPMPLTLQLPVQSVPAGNNRVTKKRITLPRPPAKNTRPNEAPLDSIIAGSFIP